MSCEDRLESCALASNMCRMPGPIGSCRAEVDRDQTELPIYRAPLNLLRWEAVFRFDKSKPSSAPTSGARVSAERLGGLLVALCAGDVPAQEQPEGQCAEYQDVTQHHEETVKCIGQFARRCPQLDRETSVAANPSVHGASEDKVGNFS